MPTLLLPCKELPPRAPSCPALFGPRSLLPGGLPRCSSSRALWPGLSTQPPCQCWATSADETALVGKPWEPATHEPQGVCRSCG
jgi:hypothetical protein